MNDPILPLLAGAIVAGFAALCLLADLDRTRFTTLLGHWVLAAAVFLLVVAGGIWVST